MSVSYPSKSATRLCPLKRCRCHVLRFILKRVSHQPLNKDAQEAPPPFPLVVLTLFLSCFGKLFSFFAFRFSSFSFYFCLFDSNNPFFCLPLATLSFLDSPLAGLPYHTKQQKREWPLESTLSFLDLTFLFSCLYDSCSLFANSCFHFLNSSFGFAYSHFYFSDFAIKISAAIAISAVPATNAKFVVMLTSYSANSKSFTVDLPPFFLPPLVSLGTLSFL